MRYCVTNTGSKADFEKAWYVASGFGEARKNSSGVITYYHEGADINLRTGGDTDLNQELKAIANGKIVYYHNSHATTANTFGRHLVYRIDGAWGTRWVHYAHCSDLNFLGGVQDVTEGQVIARVGKSGTQYVHLHLAILKVDPTSIDNIANTQAELNQYWEDPIAFINTWIATPTQPTIPVPTDQSKYDFGEGFGIMELQAARGIMHDLKRQSDNYKQRLVNGATSMRELANRLED